MKRLVNLYRGIRYLPIAIATLAFIAGCATPVCTTIQGATVNGHFAGTTFAQGNGDVLTICTAGLTTSTAPMKPASAATP